MRRMHVIRRDAHQLIVGKRGPHTYAQSDAPSLLGRYTTTYPYHFPDMNLKKVDEYQPYVHIAVVNNGVKSQGDLEVDFITS